MSLSLNIPVIETERLILRGPRESDFEPFAAFSASERAKFVGGPYTRYRSWGGFLAGYGHWALRGYGMWMLEDRASGATAGRVGVIFNEGWDEPELGWHIYDGFEGRGLAYEAALAARDYAARHFGITAPISYIDPANTRSKALADRLGARFEREGEVVGEACHVYRHPATEAA
ncbi:GNAT family N-acetyltransferase [Thalassovita sp.]|uniref:GNAT family N-acetyltransferase n=1 Tax=Thalassovita sp. TaxID=1979401 RepID=UPI002B2741E5|nr:GNAT family N-acetyltransferase [Thalassovita sp.]